MTFLDCCRAVREDGLRLIRPRADSPNQYDLKEPYTGRAKGWTWLDTTSANIVLQVYEALPPQNQEKFQKLSANRALYLCWRAANGK